MENQNSNQKYGLAVASLVLGIIALAFSFVPGLCFIGLLLGTLSVVLGVVATFLKNPIWLVTTALIIGVTGLGISIYSSVDFYNSITELGNILNGLNGLF